MDMSVDLILGPIVLAVVANVSSLLVLWMFVTAEWFIQAVLYGTCVVQWYTYWISGFKDPWHTR